MTHPSIPTATYRFQFFKGFTFRQAEDLAGYLRDLGISHVYASPFFKAAPGSTHGYDICDHNEINPEVGTREEFESFSRALTGEELGLLVDFVPNHMGIAEARNVWWTDVLEHGPASPHASYFDIDWHPVKRELEGKVLLPILGDQYGRVLEKGELKVAFQEGIFTVRYYETSLPLEPGSTRMIMLPAALALRGQITEDQQAELESILTALEHLPPPGTLDRDKIAERAREQLVIKRRLKALAQEVPAVEEAIGKVIEAIQTPGEVGYAEFDALLQAQNYRLSFWRVASEEINYRRFFDINTLAAIRMELPEVFDATHRLIFELIQAGMVHGLRIDHVDGLYDPARYLAQLQSRYAECVGLPEGSQGLYLLVEKILGQDEHLRSDWPAHGTTGYEFANQVNGVLVDQAAQKAFSLTYLRFVPEKQRFSDLVYRSKLLVMQSAMASEVNVLGHMLNRLSETNRWYRDFTLNSLTAAVRETIACFPVYRTYIAPGGAAGEIDRRVIDRALNAARRRNPALERSVFSFLRDVLLPGPEASHPVDEAARMEFVLKFQQCTSPITAKGVEDTAFYNYNRLIALNEVGGDPGLFGVSPETFHAQNAARLTEFPHCMVATSSHDTKRSEDVRARIAALSESPKEWTQSLRRWELANRVHKQELDGESAPSANEEYLIYQTLIGAWPLELIEGAPAEGVKKYPYEEFVQRIQAYMLKALHEAKVNSSWIEPNQAWDQAVSAFVAKILERKRGNRFPKAFLPLATKMAQLGAINSLSQLVLKMTVPGVPDFYQGNELWDLSLVDPDNRRPVDYALRKKLLAELGEQPDPAELLEHWTDGRIKLFVTREVLRFRRSHSALFAQGAYHACAATGELAGSALAFTRAHEGKTLIVCVPRLSSRVGFPPIGDKWRDTSLEIAGEWRNVFTGARLSGERLALADVLRDLPVALLIS